MSTAAHARTPFSPRALPLRSRATKRACARAVLRICSALRASYMHAAPPQTLHAASLGAHRRQGAGTYSRLCLSWVQRVLSSMLSTFSGRPAMMSLM